MMTTVKQKTVFAGPGIMGKPMAKNLIKAGDDQGGLIRSYEKKSGVKVRSHHS